jgi:hypothetical protein
MAGSRGFGRFPWPWPLWEDGPGLHLSATKAAMVAHRIQFLVLKASGSKLNASFAALQLKALRQKVCLVKRRRSLCHK